MAEKDAYTILLEASQGKLNSSDLYKGKPVNSVIEVAVDAINELEMEIQRLNYIIRQKNKQR